MSRENTEIAAEVVRAARGGAPVAVATVVRAPDAGQPAMGAKLLVREDGSRSGALGGGAFEEAVAADCLAALTRLPRVQAETRFYSRDGESMARRSPESFEATVEVTERPASLLIIGAGHIGPSLAVIGAHAWLALTVLDDRGSFANEDRVPAADRLSCGDII